MQQQLIDVYFQAFPRTLLLMNFDELQALVYGTKKGAGWRLDCWGDMGHPFKNFAHMLDLYPQQIARGRLQDIWRTAPVSLETCGVPESWRQWGFSLKPILDQALRWHASTINIKSSRIPPEWKPAFDDFQKQIGDRFVLRKLEYPTHARRGSMVEVNMWWSTQESRRCTVIICWRSKSAILSYPSRQTFDSGCRAILCTRTLYRFPGILNLGNIDCAWVFCDPHTRTLAIRLGIVGRQTDGWYDLGDITVGLEIRIAGRLLKNSKMRDRLDHAIAALTSLNGTTPQVSEQRTMSPSARRRIAAAQRARWARQRNPARKASVTPWPKRRKIRTAGIARIRAAAKRRWAKVRAAKKH